MVEIFNKFCADNILSFKQSSSSHNNRDGRIQIHVEGDVFLHLYHSSSFPFLPTHESLFFPSSDALAKVEELALPHWTIYNDKLT